MILQRERETEKEKYMVRDNYNKLTVFKFRIHYLFYYSSSQKLSAILKKNFFSKETIHLIVYQNDVIYFKTITTKKVCLPLEIYK